LFGARKPSQIEDNMKAVEIYKKIDKDIFIEIEKIMDNVSKKKKLRRLEL
jgi:aryl-alcohol dehydrogenase-like predicted oxidoreductase